MRRYWVVALAVLALLGVLSPPAFSQAPTPKVTITGILDTVTSWNKNFNQTSPGGDITNAREEEWYTRHRFRPDFIMEVGKAKAVWGVEMDVAWGQASFSDTGIAGSALGSSSKVGTTANFDLNTDTLVVVETKWLYVDFPVPMVPVPTQLTLGAQPWAATFKPGIFATGDYPGVNMVTTWTPAVKTHFAYAQIEERLTAASESATTSPFNRGDDFAIILSAEVTPMKGLDVRPIYSYAYYNGTTNGASRANVGGLLGTGVQATYFKTDTTNDIATPNGRTAFRPDDKENRHTIGIDSRWKWGNLSVDPTLMYQWGSRQTSAYGCASAGQSTGTSVNCDGFATAATGGHSSKTADISAWLVDLRASYQWGPLNIGVLYMYTSGNNARVSVRDAISYFQPISTDTLYTVGWSELLTAGVDYLTQMHTGAVPGNPLSMGNTIGYDKYGRHGFTVRGIYDLTPAWSLRAIVSPMWTAQKVDTNTTTACVGNPFCYGYSVTPAGFAPVAEGDSRYLGTELDFGFTWRFAPGLTLDGVYGVLFAGSARDVIDASPDQRSGASRANPIGSSPQDAKDVYLATMRIRYSF